MRRVSNNKLHDTTERLDFFKPIETSTADGNTEMVGVGEWDEDQEDDDEGWITEDNIKEYTEAFTGVVSKDTENRYCQVACLTSDFSMQVSLKSTSLIFFLIKLRMYYYK